MLIWSTKDARSLELLGFIPSFLSDQDPRPAREQFNTAYAHGGGWRPFTGFKMADDLSLTYPGDPRLHPIATAQLRDEVIIVYEYALVVIKQNDGSFEVCRMD